MVNTVKTKIDSISEWIEKHPEVTQPNMTEFAECICLCSNQVGNMREASIQSFSRMYALRFGRDCPNIQETKMWKLFRKLCNSVIVDNIHVSVDESAVVELVIRVASYVIDGNIWDNEVEERQLELWCGEYDGIFKHEVKEAYAEIKERALLNLV